MNLPHDWAIEGPFDLSTAPPPAACPSSAPAGIASLSPCRPRLRASISAIEFDGAMSNSKVWLNGHDLGGRPYGYIGFSLDLTAYLKFGAANVIAVRLTPEDHSSRWYPGAGIYRNVWLDVYRPGTCRPLGHVCHDAQGDGCLRPVSVKTRSATATRRPRRQPSTTAMLGADRQDGEPQSANGDDPREGSADGRRIA